MKFRVYDNINGRYVTDEQVWSLTPEGKLFYIDTGKALNLTTVSDSDYCTEYFTNCYDEACRQIYMNDVIQLSNGLKGVVRYGKHFDWASNVMIEGWYIHTKCEDEHALDFHLNSFHSNYYNIIGNIHEFKFRM